MLWDKIADDLSLLKSATRARRLDLARQFCRSAPHSVFPDAVCSVGSFFCGKETRFDQSKLSCLHNQDAIPCDSSSDWLFRNDAFGTAEDQEDQQRELAAS